MSIFATTRRVLGPMLMQIKSLSKDSKKYIKTFSPIKEKYRKPRVNRFPRCNCRRICQSSRPLDGLCIPFKSFPETETLHRNSLESKSGWMSQINEAYIRPVARYPGYPGMRRTPMPPFVGNWRWYAQTQPGKGGGVKESGGRIGKLDAANEDGFFHEVNKSRLEEIKRMLKEKSLLKGSDAPHTKP